MEESGGKIAYCILLKARNSGGFLCKVLYFSALLCIFVCAYRSIFMVWSIIDSVAKDKCPLHYFLLYCNIYG